jgi:ribosome-associated toxin RatA of RatAB toxin-antitoxin module
MRQSTKNREINLDSIEAKMIKMPFKYLSYKYPIEALKAKLERGS